jgi:hypothetical protein
MFPPLHHRICARPIIISWLIGTLVLWIITTVSLYEGGVFPTMFTEWWSVLVLLANYAGMIVLGFIVGVCTVYWLVVRICRRINGAPFTVGDYVTILIGPRIGTVARVYKHTCGQVGDLLPCLDFGAEIRDNHLDSFEDFELLRHSSDGIDTVIPERRLAPSLPHCGQRSESPVGQLPSKKPVSSVVEQLPEFDWMKPTFVEQWFFGSYLVCGIFPTPVQSLTIDSDLERVPGLYAITKAKKDRAWPRGVCSYFLIPIYISDTFDAEITLWIYSLHKYRWAILHEPILYSTRHNSVVTRLGRSPYGSFYHSFLLRIVNVALRPIASHFHPGLPYTINGSPNSKSNRSL